MSDIDPAVLEQLAADVTAEDLRAVISASEADLLRTTGVLLAAAQAGDTATILRTAHIIAGVASIVGARSLEQDVRALMVSDATAAALTVPDATRIAARARAVIRAVHDLMTARGYDA